MSIPADLVNNPGPAHSELRQRAADGIRSMGDLLAIYRQGSRFLELDTPLGPDVLLIDRFDGVEGLNTLYEFQASCLSDNLYLDLRDLIGRQVSVSLKLPLGGKRQFNGYVTDFAQTGSDGGFARYELSFRPWLWLLTLRRDAWVFQDKTVVEILQEVFADYPQANYRLDLQGTYPKRSYCVQYRETDYEFVTRLMAEEGIGFTFEFLGADERGDDEARHPSFSRMVIADHNDAYGEDASSSASGGIRFHRADVTEDRDGILAFGGERVLQTNQVRLTSWDYKAARTGDAMETTSRDNGDAPSLQAYDAPGNYYFSDAEQGQRYARTRLEVLEARNKKFSGEGAVGSFHAGSWFQLNDHPVHDEDPPEERQFLLISVAHQARNNLPEDWRKRLTNGLEVPDAEPNFTYRNHFTALRRNVVYRPVFSQAEHPKPTVLGPQTALVVGPAGEEIYTDDQHRVRIQFHWQRQDNRPGDERASCWVRVASPMAGSGYGGNFIPRIGQEVLVNFVESDIDRPVITGRVYNGGREPAWHAPGILSGYKTKEYQGAGYNQFVMDDASGQLRTAFHTTSQSSQLNLGWLIHQNDNTRGPERGHGFELRSDAWGALRGAMGLYLTTHPRLSAGGSQQDAAEATAQLDSGLELARRLSDGARHHLADPLQAQDAVTAIKEVSAHRTDQGNTQVPQFRDPILLAASADDLALASDRSVHVAAGDHVHLSVGQDANLAAGRDASVAIRDAASLFAQKGAVKVYAAQGPVSLQAQSDEMQLIADRSVTVTSVGDEITVTAKDHLLLTAGGAYVRLQGGNIDIHAPGKVSIKGATHDFSGPASMSSEHSLPSPAEMKLCEFKMSSAAASGDGLVRL